MGSKSPVINVTQPNPVVFCQNQATPYGLTSPEATKNKPWQVCSVVFGVNGLLIFHTANLLFFCLLLYIRTLILGLVSFVLHKYYVHQHVCKKQAVRVPGGWYSQISRQSAHEGGKVVSPTHRPPLFPMKYSWY